MKACLERSERSDALRRGSSRRASPSIRWRLLSKNSGRTVIGEPTSPWQNGAPARNGAPQPLIEGVGMSFNSSSSPGSADLTATVPAWSEDPLTARAKAVWTGGDFLQIARSFAAGAEEFIARLAL